MQPPVLAPAPRRPRLVVRGVRALLGLSALLITLQPACGPDAIGVSACREIENARCVAATACGEDTGVQVTDVEACQRFYRDQCLHGLMVEDEPSRTRLKRCVKTLEEAGSCLREHAQSGDTAIGTCTFTEALGDTRVTTACGLLAEPEQIEPCGFLTAEGPSPPAAGGTGGTGGTGGAGGTGGSAGAGGTATSGGTSGGGGSP